MALPGRPVGAGVSAFKALRPLALFLIVGTPSAAAPVAASREEAATLLQLSPEACSTFESVALIQKHVEVRRAQPGAEPANALQDEEGEADGTAAAVGSTADVGGDERPSQVAGALGSTHIGYKSASAMHLAQSEAEEMAVEAGLNVTWLEDQFRRGEVNWHTWGVGNLSVFLIYVLLSLVLWFGFYPDEPFELPDHEDSVTTFQRQHFACFKSPGICLWACCCPALRWSDTMSRSGFLPFFTALLTYYVCMLVNGFVWTSFYYGIVTCLLMLYYRQKLRAKLALTSCTCTTCCVDCLYVLLCPWCAIAQEARVVRYAVKEFAGFSSGDGGYFG